MNSSCLEGSRFPSRTAFSMERLILLVALLPLAAGFALLPRCPSGATRARPAAMDETILEKALQRGGLEEEGGQNHWLSEVGWAKFMDEEAKSSYAMNQRPSKEGVGWYTPDVFSNPFEVAISAFEGIKRAVSAPLETAFPTLSNDKTGNRAWPAGMGEQDARTIKFKSIKAKERKKLIQVGLPGFNDFGAPSVDRKAMPKKTNVFGLKI